MKSKAQPVEVKSKRVPVLVDNETYCQFQAYSKETGITVTHAVSEALSDWMNIVGAARLEAFKKPGSAILRDNLVQMPPTT